MNVELIVGLVVAVGAVAGGALLTFRISKQRNRSDINRVTIRDVDTAGDVAGRDINKPK